MPFQTQEVTNWFKRKIIFKTAGGEMLVSWEGNAFAWTLRRVRTAHSQWFDQGFGWRQLPSLSLPLIKMNSEDRPTRWECRQSGTKGLWNDQLCDFVKQKHQKKQKKGKITHLSFTLITFTTANKKTTAQCYMISRYFEHFILLLHMF